MVGKRGISLPILFSIVVVILYVCLSLANESGNEEGWGTEDEVQEEVVLKANIVVRNNVIGDSGFGIYIGSREDSIAVIDNTIIDNGEGIRLLGTESKQFISGNTIIDNIVGVRVTDYYQGITFSNMAVSSITIRSNTIAGNKEHNLLNLTSGVLDMDDNSWEKTHKEQEDGEDETASAPDDRVASLALPIPLFVPTLTFDLSSTLTMTTTIAMIGDRTLMGVTFLWPMAISLFGLSFVP